MVINFFNVGGWNQINFTPEQLSCFNNFKLITCVISAPEIDKWNRCC